MTLAQAKADLGLPEGSRDARVERPRRRRRRLDPAVFVSILALIVLVASLAQVAQRAGLVALTYDLHKANTRLAELKRVQTQLLVEVERARSLSRVEADARSRLGMTRPESTTWVVLEPADSPDRVRLATAQDDDGWAWLSLVSGWFDRVRSDIQTALPLDLREPGR